MDQPLILARSTVIFWRARAPYLLVESLNVILNFKKLRESGKRKESFFPHPPPSHTITLGVDDRQACNPPNKTSPEHSTCFCTSHQLWKMWLVESIQPGKFACLASKLFVRVVELNFFFSVLSRGVNSMQNMMHLFGRQSRQIHGYLMISHSGSKTRVCKSPF